ncbi:MAG: hypothetical protein K5927_03390 [Lachnospiraceae bacterium]|nr:hypothetical protein [Lachnospiraceae bacterium]
MRRKAVAMVVLGLMLTACSGQGKEEPSESAKGTNAAESSTEAAKEETTTEPATEPSTKPATTAQPETESPDDKYPVIAFSGKEEDKIEITQDSVYEGDRFVLLVENGSVLPGNAPQLIEDVMTIEEEISHLSFSVTDYAEKSSARSDWFESGFSDYPYNNDKLYILVCKDTDSGAIEWSESNEVALFDSDFDREATNYQTLYHEIAHALRLRQSPGLGKIVEEGFAVYMSYHTALKMNTPAWGMIQFVKIDGWENMYDDSELYEDPVKAFERINVAPRSKDQPDYQYGIRLMEFMTGEYGEDIMLYLSEYAAEHPDFKYNESEKIMERIKAVTSDDVFERFLKWLGDGYDGFSRGVYEHLLNYGL